MFKAHFRALLVALVALPLLLTGCDEIIGSDRIEGTYRLATYNGKPVPTATREDDEFREELVRGSIVLRSGGVATVMIESKTTDRLENVSETERVEETGTYTVAGDRLTLSLDNGSDIVEGVIGGGKITVGSEDDDEVYVFRR